MSVYTTLTLKEVQDFAAPYGLEVIDLIPIQGGIQNTNYFLVCEDQSQYVLTVFEEMDEHGAGEIVPQDKPFTLLNKSLPKLHRV